MELLYGYFNIATGEIILASPRINPTIERELKPVFEELTHLIKDFVLEFSVLLYRNDTFSSEIMQPGIASDTISGGRLSRVYQH